MNGDEAGDSLFHKILKRFRRMTTRAERREVQDLQVQAQVGIFIVRASRLAQMQDTVHV